MFIMDFVLRFFEDFEERSDDPLKKEPTEKRGTRAYFGWDYD